MEPRLTEKIIQKKLWNKYQSHKYRFLNIRFFASEQDWLSFTKTDYCWEIEVKVSKSDFMADFKNKTEKHDLYNKLHKGQKVVTIKQDYQSYNYIRDKNEITFPELFQKLNYAHGRIIGKEIKSSYINYQDRSFAPNKFFYCVPEEIKEYCLERLPDYCGLMAVDKYGFINIVKKAPWIHKEKIDVMGAFSKLYYNYEHIIRKFLADIKI